ncbi:hypothetical protein F4703DRAFT_1828417 [Phycomyces blakesleeanus]
MTAENQPIFPAEVFLMILAYMSFINVYKLYSEFPANMKPFVNDALIKHQIFNQRRLLIILSDYSRPTLPNQFLPGSEVPEYHYNRAPGSSSDIRMAARVSSVFRTPNPAYTFPFMYELEPASIDYENKQIFFKASGTRQNWLWVTHSGAVHITIILVDGNRILKRALKATAPQLRHEVPLSSLSGKLELNNAFPGQTRPSSCTVGVDWFCT